MSNSITIDDNGKKRGKSMSMSFLLHALLLLIAFFLVLPNKPPVQDPPLPPEEVFLVNLDVPAFKQRAREIDFEESTKGTKGKAEEGAAAPNDPTPPPASTPSNNPTPASSPEVIKPSAPATLPTTKPVISAPPISTKTEENIPTVKPTPSTSTTTIPPKTSTTTTSPTKTTTTSTPTRTGTNPDGGGAPNSNGSTVGTTPGRTSGKDGTGTGSGRTGTGGGATGGPDANEGEGNASTGTGAYDGTGDGVFGRKVIFRDNNAAKLAMTTTGLVVIKICVNQAGIVTFAEVNNIETTIKDRSTLKNFLKAARNYKVQPDKTAPKEQCGKLSFKTNNVINNKLK
jgi:outer membrane biosynthesis protein TonB